MHTRAGDAAMKPRGCIIFIIIQRSGVNYSAYTMVATRKGGCKGERAGEIVLYVHNKRNCVAKHGQDLSF